MTYFVRGSARQVWAGIGIAPPYHLEGVVPGFLTASLVIAGQPRIRLRSDTIDDIWILCRYSASS
jgi:hypothetical protein